MPVTFAGEDLDDRTTQLSEMFTQIEDLALTLATKPSIDSLARLLALRVLQPFDVFAVAIVAMDAVGSYRVMSSFGYDEESVHSLNTTGLSWRTPLATTIREGRSIWTDMGPEVLEEFPDLAVVPVDPAIRSTVTLPIGDKTPLGGLLITMREPLIGAPPPVQMRFLECIASLLSIVVDGPRVRDELLSRGARPPAPPPGSLSDRQTAILRLIAEGKTNKAIGTRLGFSESTVRHETMRIFRLLGVASRSQAVTVAATRGILPLQREPES
jgi:DNA-binding CsgD family transcriptional regulator